VDGQTAEEYAANLEQNLLSLVERIKSGRYYAPAVRRHYIPKRDGGQRGLGIASFEDKVAQRAIVMLLEPIYEQDFSDCSFGFRPKRSAHQALQEIWLAVMKRGGRWVSHDPCQFQLHDAVECINGLLILGVFHAALLGE
jgi:retron-type reverse transcriptase